MTIDQFSTVVVKPSKKLGYPFTQRTMTARKAWDAIKNLPEHLYQLTLVTYDYHGTKRTETGRYPITRDDLFTNV